MPLTFKVTGLTKKKIIDKYVKHNKYIVYTKTNLVRHPKRIRLNL